MDDFDNLNSKTDSDLRQIAVAFGDFTPEEAEAKTRDELLMAITGAKDIGDITPVDLAEDPVPVKPGAIPEPMKSTENQKSLDELIVDVGRTARFETNELADAMIKAEKKEKKVAKKVTEEAAAEPKEEKKTEAKEKAEKKPVKRTSKKAAKAEEKPAETSPAAEASAAEVPAEEPKKAEKKTAAKTKKTKTTKKKADAPEAEAVKEQEPTPVEALAAAAVAEVPAEAPAAEAAVEAKTEDKKPEQVQNQGQGRHGRSKRRKISFGPGQDTKTVETTDEAPAEGDEEVPEIVLPVEIEIEGVLAINNNEGNKNDFCGFVHRNNYLPGEDDAYVPGQMIKRMGLRRGDYIKGFAIPKRGKDRYAPLKRITEVNGIPVIENEYDNIRRRPKFESLTAIYPDERLDLETEKEDHIRSRPGYQDC